MPFLLLRRPFMPLRFFTFPNPKPYPFRLFTNPSTSLAMSATNISGGVYVPPMRRLRSIIEVPPSNGARSMTTPSVSNGGWRDSAVGSSWQQSAGYSKRFYDDWSDDDSDMERDRSPVSSKGGSNLDNMEEWRWRLGMLLKNERDLEIVTRERKDRREFDQLSQLAERMGLYCCQNERVVVFSKVPLPNYRPDLDDRKPLREVSIPFDLQREVDNLLGDHLQRKRSTKGVLPGPTFSRSSSSDSFGAEEGLDQQSDVPSAVMEKILRRRSLNVHNQQ